MDRLPPLPPAHTFNRLRLAALLLTLPWAAAWAGSGSDGAPDALTRTTPASLQQALDSPALPPAWLNADAAQRSAPDAATLAQWWRQFGDARLTALVEAALARNTDLRIARATLAQARAARAATEAGARPQASTSASASRNRSNGRNTNSFSLGFSASWEPDFNGAQQAALDAASADEMVSAQDLWATQVSLTAEVGLAYLNWRDALARQAITQRNLATQEQTLQLISWRAQAGLVSGLDLDNARLTAEQTRAGLPSLATEVAGYDTQLALLTGRSPQAHASAMAQWPAAPVSAQPGEPLPGTDALVGRTAVGLPADLLRQRPDLRAAEASVIGQWYRRDQTRREGLPSFSLSGSLGLQALTLAGLSASGAGVAALAAGIDWKIFDGGQREALVAQQDALLESTRIQLEAALLTALKDVEDSLVALRSSRERVASMSRAGSAAQDVYDATLHRYEAGLIDTTSLLDAQRTLLSVQTTLQSSQTELAQNLVQLYKALGGGWPASPAAAG